MIITPATATPGQTVKVKGSGSRHYQSRIYVGTKLVASFRMGSGGTYDRSVVAPVVLGPVDIFLKQRRYDGVWRTADTGSLKVEIPAPPPPPPPPPTPTLTYTTSVPAGSVLKGVVSLLATVTQGTPSHMELRVDGVVHWDEFYAPWGGDFDSTIYPDGQHLIEWVGYDAQGAHSPVGGHVTIANAIPAPPPPSGLVWGTGMSGDTRSNQQIGGWDRGKISYRFPALGGSVGYISVVQRGGPVYSKGNDIRLRATFQTDSNGSPSGVILGFVEWVTKNPPPSNELEPGQGAQLWEIFKDIILPAPLNLPAGILHLVVENISTDPVNNYISLNVLLSYDGYRQLALGPEFRALYAKGAGAWSIIDKSIPVFDVGYADGRHDGQGYIGILFGNGGPNGTMHGEISGQKHVRERLNPAARVTVSAMNVKVKRINDGGSPLIVALEGPGFSDAISILASSIPKGDMPAGQGAKDLGNNTWVRAQLPSSRVLLPGAYAMRLSTNADTRYIAVPLQEGTPKGLASYRFLDGAAEQSLNGGSSWNPLYWEPTDLQFYLEA